MKINIFDYPKVLEILKFLYLNQPTRATDVSKTCDIQYSYASKQLGLLTKLNLIERKKTGREVFITLTDRGKEVGKKVYEIKRLVK